MYIYIYIYVWQFLICFDGAFIMGGDPAQGGKKNKMLSEQV